MLTKKFYFYYDIGDHYIFRHIGFVFLFPGFKEKKGWPYTIIGSKLCYGYCKIFTTASHGLQEFDQKVKN